MNDPFLDERHRSLAQKAKAFGDRHLRSRAADESDPIGQTREVLLLLSDARLLEHCVPPPHGMMDVRSLVTVREQLAYFSGIADTAFAMQGLGSHAISLAGSEALQKRWLPPVMGGELPAAFALTEPEAGSDLASLRTRAERDGAAWRLTGVKTLISNAGIAGFYTVLARSSKEEGHAALSMFLVDAHSSGISFKPIELIAPHPIGQVHFESTPAVLVGGEGQGYKLSLATLDAFRPSVGAAACGMAARALVEAVRWALGRRQFGRPLSALQSVQHAIADMHVELKAARLMVRQAAWAKDSGAERITREGASAKLIATETAQRVVDRALQIHGGQGVVKGTTVERLYREVRALRIYEGASEVLKSVIARSILDEYK